VIPVKGNVMMEEELTKCSSCDKQVPRSQFCIYCGYNLLKDRGRILQVSEEEHPTFKPPESTTSFVPEDTNFSRSLAEGIMPSFPIAPVMEPTSDTQVMQARRELLKYQIWRVKLCGILCEQGMLTRVFTNIWEGYGNDVARLKREIDESQRESKTSYEDKMAELENAKLKLDELRVRVVIGEISDSNLLIKTPSIRANIESLEHEVSLLKEQLKEEETKPSSDSPREMFEHEQLARGLVSKIDDLVTEGKLSIELGKRLGAEMEEIREYFYSMVGDQGEQELLNELDTLEVRYKVGEITLAELESLKREIVAKLDRHWVN
jgi:polyhydroxyalkanoate synthesis regulator phasin